MNDLAGMLLAGRGCSDAVPDLAGAEEWYRAAAEQGYARSMLGLANMCAARGELEEALEWLTRSAEQRAEPETLYRLGRAHIDGGGGAERDESVGEAWLREAAEMGHPKAQLTLGELLGARAQRILPSTATAGIMGQEAAAAAWEEAERWLNRASSQGEANAARALLSLYVARRDVAAVQRLAWAWLASRRLLSSKFSSHGSLKIAASLATVPVALVGVLALAGG